MIEAGDKIARAETRQRFRLIGVALLTIPPAYSCALGLMALAAVLRPALVSPELLLLILRQARTLRACRHRTISRHAWPTRWICPSAASSLQ